MATQRLEYIFDLLKGKNTLGPEFKKLQDETEAIQDNLAKIRNVAAVAFAGFTASIYGAVKAASGFEDIAVSFNVITGSVKKTNEVMKILEKSAAGDAFSFPQVADAAKRFLTFGFEIKDLNKLLLQTGNVAAISGSSIEDLARIFGKVSTEGKFTTRELMQLQNSAIPIGPALAKTMGIGEESVKRLAEQGRINFAQFQKAFASLSETGGFAFGGLEQVAGTLTGKIENMKDEFELLASGIGKFFLPIFKLAIDDITALIDRIKDNEALTSFISKLLAVGAVLTGAVAVIATVTSSLIGLSLAYKAVTIAAQAAGVTMKTALISSGIGILILGISLAVADLAANWELRTKQMVAIWEAFGKFVSAIWTNISTIFNAALDLLIARFEYTFSYIQSILTGFIDTAIANITNMGEVIQKAFTFDFQGAKKEIGDFSTVTSEGMDKTSAAIDEASTKFDEFRIGLGAKTNLVPVKFEPNLDKIKVAVDEVSKPIDKIVKITGDSGGFASSIGMIYDSVVAGFNKGGISGALKGFATSAGKVTKDLGTNIKNAFKNADFSKFKEGVGLSLVQSLKSGEEGAKKFISGTVGAVATAMFGPIGQMASGILDLMMMSSDELNKTIDSFMAAIPKIVEQIIKNIPVIIIAIVRNIPMLIEAFMNIALLYGTDPIFWNKVMISVSLAFIAAVPKMVQGFVSGFKDGLTNGIIASFKEAFDKLTGFWKKIFSFDGGGKGAVEKFLGFDFPFIAFAEGGRVKGNARVKGDSPLNDTVPALLSPDEIVIPRTVALSGDNAIFSFLAKMKAITPQRNAVQMAKESGLKPVQRWGIGSITNAISNAVGSVGQSVVEAGTGFVDSLGNTVGGNFNTDFINNTLDQATGDLYKAANYLGVDGLLEKLGFGKIQEFLDLIRSLLKIGLNPDVPSLIKDPMNYISNLIKNNVGIFKEQFRGLMKPLPLAMGGLVQGSGFSDSIPAMLTPKELVVDRSTTRQLQSFLNGNQGGNSSSIDQVLALLQQPIQVKTTANVNGQAFADIILELSRKNSRLTI